MADDYVCFMAVSDDYVCFIAVSDDYVCFIDISDDYVCFIAVFSSPEKVASGGLASASRTQVRRSKGLAGPWGPGAGIRA